MKKEAFVSCCFMGHETRFMAYYQYVSCVAGSDLFRSCFTSHTMILGRLFHAP